MITMFSNFYINKQITNQNQKQALNNRLIPNQVDSVCFSGKKILPSTLVAIDYIEKLKASLIKANIPLKTNPISATTLARQIQQETGLQILPEKFNLFVSATRTILKNAGFETAGKETPASKVIKKAVENLKAEYIAGGKSFKKNPVSSTEFAKKILQESRLEIPPEKFNGFACYTRFILKDAGFETVDLKTVAQIIHETPESKAIKKAVENLKAEYIANGKTFKDHPVSETTLARQIQQETGLKILPEKFNQFASYTRIILKDAGFETVEKKTAMQAAMETPASKAIKQAVENLKAEYIANGKSFEGNPISATTLARQIQQETGLQILPKKFNRFASYTGTILKNAGFETVDLKTAMQTVNETPASKAIKKAVENLKAEYIANGKSFEDDPVSSTEFAKKILQESELQILPKKFYQFASSTGTILKDAGFKTVDKKAAKETPASKAIKQAVENLKAEYIASGKSFEDNPVSSTEFVKKIQRETGIKIPQSSLCKRLKNAGFTTQGKKQIQL